MQEYHGTVSGGGRVVIPAFIRNELGIEVGEEVLMKIEDGEIRISSLSEAVKKAQAIVKKYNTKGVSLVEMQNQMREEERQHEQDDF